MIEERNHGTHDAWQQIKKTNKKLLGKFRMKIAATAKATANQRKESCEIRRRRRREKTAHRKLIKLLSIRFI